MADVENVTSSSEPKDGSAAERNTAREGEQENDAHAHAYLRPVSPVLLENQVHYETQFFGFTPLAFNDGIYNSLITYAWELLEQSQIVLKNDYPDLVKTTDINKASADIFPKLMKSFQRAFDKLELYVVQNIFHVQDHVILSEDEIQEEHPKADETETQLDDEIEVLKEKIRIAKYMNARLKREIADVAIVQADLDKIIKQMQTIEKAAGAHGNLGEYIGFVCSKAIELKRLLENVDGQAPPKKLRIDKCDSNKQEGKGAC